jgi:mannose-6-phosphate isomerase-like protein (cupin superfamily)
VLGHSITTLLEKKHSGGNYYVFECITPPGMGIPPHVHDREDEIISIVEGEFDIMLGDRQFKASAGDLCYFPKHIPHSFQNTGSRAGKTLWTVIPGANFEEFFENLGALPAGEPDLKMIAKIFSEYGMMILIPESA